MIKIKATKQRDSNFELLRLISMLLVVFTHVSFWALGAPGLEDIQRNFTDATIRVSLQSLGIPCVNIFVMISGWYGIRPSRLGVTAFLFQCIFYSIVIYSIALQVGISTFDKNNILKTFFLSRDYWFVKSYLFLYLLSPILNSFVQTSSRAVFEKVLISFFIFQTIFGWLYPLSVWNTFYDGYSTISFLGLYLLGRYIKIYRPQFSRFSIKIDALIIVGMIAFCTLVYITPPGLGLNTVVVGRKLLSYISPTTIVLSVYFILFFSKLSFTSHIVNWSATGAFAIYLVHMNPHISDYVKEILYQLHSSQTTGMYYGLLALFIIVLFVSSIFIDKIRSHLWLTFFHNVFRISK